MIPFALKHLMLTADAKYGAFASTHEAFGVLSEEVAELLDAIRANDMHKVQMECMDVASVVIRLANQLADGGPIVNRSRK